MHLNKMENSTLCRISVGSCRISVTENFVFKSCMFIAFLIILNFVLSPYYSSLFLEYIIKFVPVFSDYGLKSIFDGYLLGDPRARPFANLFGYINFVIRQKILLDWPIPPAISIAWIVYPVTLVAFYRVIYLLSQSYRAAAMAVVILGFSPSLMDIFVDYYIPAKPLVLLLFVICLMIAGELVNPNIRFRSRSLSKVLCLILSLFCALLTDETACFAAICIPLMFMPSNTLGKKSLKQFLILLIAIMITIIIYFVFIIFAMPAINNILDQSPVDMGAIVLNGVYYSMFGENSVSLRSLFLEGYSPFGLLKTIISAHIIPFRYVTAVWTGPELKSWEVWECFIAALFFIFWFSSLFYINRQGLRKIIWLIVSFFTFILIQALILLRLSPYIMEVNYYANLSSIFVAMLIAIPMGLWSTGPDNSERVKVAWLAVLFVSTVEIVNFFDTASRHPMSLLDPSSLTWGELKDGYRMAREGSFEEWSKSHPYPAKSFLWAFEAAAAEKSVTGEKIDLIPFRAIPQPLSYIDFSQLNDPKVPKLPAPRFRSVHQLMQAGAQPVAVKEVINFNQHNLKGRFGDWELFWRLKDNKIEQRSWRSGLMRVWTDHADLNDDMQNCPFFKRHTIPCPEKYYALDGYYFGAYASDKIELILKVEPLS